jgi:hypothetical protein
VGAPYLGNQSEQARFVDPRALGASPIP